MNGSSEEIITELKNKIGLIIHKVNSLKEENSQLKLKNNNLNIELKEALTKNTNIEEKYNNIQLAKTILTGSEDKHEAKLKVNRIVREIDKCIALLNK